jgi:hypothetical protein
MPKAPPSVNQHLPSASQILLENLTLPKTVLPILRNLDNFSKNLERLANLDNLNASSNSLSFNCFEAITGIYTSLKKLYDHEKKAALELIDAKKRSEERAERHVMCKMSGRPQLNARGTVGLSIEYWMHKRHTFAPDNHSSTPKAGADEMEIDSTPAPESEHLKGQDIFTLIIECENSAPEEYVAARTSNAWISDLVEKPSDHPDSAFGPSLDWLDPPAIYLANTTGTDPDSMALDNNGVAKLPNVRFLAKLDPPLEIPVHVAANIFAIVNAQQDVVDLQYYHSMVLQSNKDLGTGDSFSSPDQDLVWSKLVDIPGNPEYHVNRLRCKPLVVGRVLKAIPFEHPKQLIQIIPVSPLFARLATLIVIDTSSVGLARIATLKSYAQVRGNARRCT